jgi:hypothetical protein
MSEDKKPQRRRTAKSPNPDSTIIKTNDAKPQNVTTKLGSASSSVVRVQPKVYSPLYLDSSLNLPRDIRTQNAWNRTYYVTNPIVRSAINLHAAYTTGKFKLVCKHKKILDFFNDMLEKMNFQSSLLEIGVEYFKIGEAIPYAELNEEQGIWDYVIVHNPDFIKVSYPSPLSRDPVIGLVPDEQLKKVLSSNDPISRKIRSQLPPELIAHLQKGEDIPLNNFNVSHLKMLSSPYDTRGVSLIASCYRDLLLYDKIREAKIVQADNFINPLTLVKLGSEQFKPTDDDIRMWQEQVLDSVGDMGYTIVTHNLVDIQKISNSGQTLDMNADLEMCIKNIMIGLMTPSALFDQDYGSYANASVGLEVLRDRYRSFQLQLKKWIEKKILEPIAKIQDFYTIEAGEKKLIVPTVEFDKINLKETDSYLNAISQALADPGTPGSGKISLRTWYELLDTNYETETSRLRLEARDAIVLQKEVEAMKSMDIAQLKTISEETPIVDSKELDSLEKSLDIKQQSDSDTGGDIEFGTGGGGPSGGMPDLSSPEEPAGGGVEPPPAESPPMPEAPAAEPSKPE